MYEWVSPDSVIPVHGEYRHLREQVNFSKIVWYKKTIVNSKWRRN